jgi:hypothetical protein
MTMDLGLQTVLLRLKFGHRHWIHLSRMVSTFQTPTPQALSAVLRVRHFGQDCIPANMESTTGLMKSRIRRNGFPKIPRQLLHCCGMLDTELGLLESGIVANRGYINQASISM